MEILNLRRVVIRSLLLTSVSLILSCSNEPIETVGDLNLKVSATASAENQEVVKDQYIVILSKKPAKADAQAEAALEALTREVGNMPNARLKNAYRSTLTGFTAKLNAAQLERIKNDKRVLAVYPDGVVELAATEYNDDLTTTNVQEYATWSLDRIDQRETVMDRAYAYSATGTGVNVYIMDSGIRYSHDEFGGRAILGIDLVKLYPDPEYDQDDPNLELGNDCNGHGTHVAGTVGGRAYGVAKDVELISVRVFSCVGRTTWSRIIQAIEWVTENAVKPAVVNMSIGGNAADPVDAAVENSVAQGIHYVIGAGNSNADACNYSPARTPGAITVGSTDINNFKANSSNFGDCVDVYAPGHDITSASYQDDISTISKNGTSMATPHVTGLAALYLQNNSAVTPAKLHNEIVLYSTPDVIKNIPAGPNRMIYTPWETVAFNPPTPPALNLQVTGVRQKNENQIYLLWEKTNDPVVDIYQNGSYVTRAQNTGELYLTTKGKGDDSFMICEVNYNNCSAQVLADFGGETTEPVNSPPTADFTFSANLLDVQFTDASTDSDGSIVSWNWTFGDGTSSSSQHPQHNYSQAGTYDISLNVTDDLGASHSVTRSISVTGETSAPAGIELSAVGSKVKGQWQTNLSWSPAGTSAQIDVYRDGVLLTTVANTGSFTDTTSLKGGGTLTYRVCEAGTTVCSNSVTVQF